MINDHVTCRKSAVIVMRLSAQQHSDDTERCPTCRPPQHLPPECLCISLASHIARSKRDGTHAETRFGLSAKRTSPFKSAGVSVHSTAGSRGVRISGQQLYRPCSDVQSKAADYPLHSHLSPSLPLPCVTVCHQVPKALYNSL